ncbi:MAG: MFS transporter [Clostridia bacterium]|nr:MFS transporter [Clostridia bacterium]
MENWKKKISLFLTSQAISLIGSSIVQYAIIWFITLKTQSGWMMTLSTICGFVPQVLISLFAGVWADRFNKKHIIMLSDGLIALSTLIISILFFFGIDSIWLLFVALGIRSLGSGVQTPTVTAFIPEVVPEDKLMRVNGINTTIQSIMLIISPAISGALLASVSLQYIFLVDVVTAIIGIGVFSFVKITFKKKEVEHANYFDSIKEGVVYTKNHKLISRMLIYLFVANFLVAPLGIMTPLLVTRAFGADPIYLTLNEIVFFVGNILGGVLISAWGGFKNRIKTIGLGCICCGILSIFLGLPFGFIFYLIVMGIMGVTMPLFNTPFITMFQENVEPEKQGRVFSLISIITGGTIPISMMLYGPLADYVKIEYILISIGILFCIGTIFLLKDKVLKTNLEHSKDNKEEEILNEIEVEQS